MNFEFQPNLPQINKESNSETEAEIWSFDRAINEVFRLFPAELCPKTQQDQAPAKPHSGIEHLMASRSTPLLVLPPLSSEKHVKTCIYVSLHVMPDNAEYWPIHLRAFTC